SSDLGARRVGEPMDDGGDPVGGGEIRTEHLDRACASALQLVGQLLEPCGVAGHEHQAVPATGEGAGVLGAEPGAGPGDQRRRRHDRSLAVGRRHGGRPTAGRRRRSTRRGAGNRALGEWRIRKRVNESGRQPGCVGPRCSENCGSAHPLKSREVGHTGSPAPSERPCVRSTASPALQRRDGLPAPRERRRPHAVESLLLAIIYIAFVSIGRPDSLVGAARPCMHQHLGVPVAFAGIITMIIAMGTIVSSLASERVTLRFGAGVVTAVSVAMTAAALVGFSFSDQFWMLCLWAIPYGLGAGAVDAALNNYVALHYAARHMNCLHSFWGVGASISPFVMSYAIFSGHGWPSAYLAIGLVQAALTLALLLSIPLWGKVDAARSRSRTVETHDLSEDAPAQRGSAPVPLMTALRVPGVVLILLAFFAYCSLESTALVWSATYMVSERGAPPAAAAMLGALFVLGLTAGRFLAGFLADRLGDRTMIRGGFLAIGLGSVLLLLPLPTDVVGFV